MIFVGQLFIVVSTTFCLTYVDLVHQFVSLDLFVVPKLSVPGAMVKIFK